MMPIPRRSEHLRVEAANEYWYTLAHNDWVLIRGLTMGFYCMNAIISKGWSAHLIAFLTAKMDKQ